MKQIDRYYSYVFGRDMEDLVYDRENNWSCYETIEKAVEQAELDKISYSKDGRDPEDAKYIIYEVTVNLKKVIR